MRMGCVPYDAHKNCVDLMRITHCTIQRCLNLEIDHSESCSRALDIRITSHQQAPLTLKLAMVKIAQRRWSLRSLFMWWEALSVKPNARNRQRGPQHDGRGHNSQNKWLSIWKKLTIFSLRHEAVTIRKNRSAILKIRSLLFVVQSAEVLKRLTKIRGNG